ncbi:hypothetical protein GCM10009765_05290 [Fodinicola feengrottensis]|uniref:Secreted protein n=1 Tax=Fodinicola feengrottensis TaxID=435914 RepID=A0ABN2FTV0_9ACTN
MARTRRNLVFVLATAAAAGLVVQAPATAGHVHVIQTANSPSTGQPVLGGGSWIVNKPSGYYVGRAMAGSVFDDEVTSSGNWHFGRASTTVDMCGWVMPGSLGGSLGDTADTCSTTTQNAISHRRTVGKDYNQPAHATGDGTAAAANTGCVVQFNYFVGTDYSSNGGHWANPAGNAASTVFYRFTTNDGAAVVVRDPNLGWGFLPIGCVQRPTALYNDND